jgi:hypothetical protein
MKTTVAKLRQLIREVSFQSMTFQQLKQHNPSAAKAWKSLVEQHCEDSKEVYYRLENSHFQTINGKLYGDGAQEYTKFVFEARDFSIEEWYDADDGEDDLDEGPAYGGGYPVAAPGESLTHYNRKELGALSMNMDGAPSNITKVADLVQQLKACGMQVALDPYSGQIWFGKMPVHARHLASNILKAAGAHEAAMRMIENMPTKQKSPSVTDRFGAPTPRGGAPTNHSRRPGAKLPGVGESKLREAQEAASEEYWTSIRQLGAKAKAQHKAKASSNLATARNLDHYLTEIYEDMESSESGTEVGERTVHALDAMQKIVDGIIRHETMSTPVRDNDYEGMPATMPKIPRY